MGNPNPVPGRPFPQHRNSTPYSLLQQQQQQGMMGTHAGLANQAAMSSPGQAGSHPWFYSVKVWFCLLTVIISEPFLCHIRHAE